MRTTYQLVTASALLALAPAAFATDVSLDSSSDTYIRVDRSYLVHGVDEVFDIRFDFVSYTQFDMSSLGDVDITDATLTLYKIEGQRNDTITNGRFSAWGLPNVAGMTDQNWHETEDFDPNDEFVGLDFRNVGTEYIPGFLNGIDDANLVSLDPEGGVDGLFPEPDVVETVDNDTGMITLTGSAFVDFVNSRIDDGGMITFITGITEYGSGKGWGIASKENADSALHPKLTLTFDGGPGVAGDFNGDTLVDADDIDLLTAAIRSGSADSQYDLDGVNGVDGGDLSFMIETVLGTASGDANLDNAVDLLDLSALASNFEDVAGWAGGNFNTDTVVDLLDLSVLASNFGFSGASVPEPAIAGVLGLGLVALRRRR